MRGNFIYKRLGAMLCKHRKAEGLSQENLATLSGVDRTFIGRVEQGKANPSYRTLYKLTNAIGIKLAVLFEGV